MATQLDPYPSDRFQLEALLVPLGYRVTFRHQSWVDCLVVGHEETWLGSGDDEQAAARNLVDRMCPSVAARSSFLRLHLPEQIPFEEPETTELPPGDPPVVIDLNLATPTNEEIESLRPEPFIETRLSEKDALERLVEVRSEIEDEEVDLAVMSTHLQRIHLASWIFQTRVVQEILPGHRRIEMSAHDIAVRLTRICKTFWPGSVRALQVETTPGQGLENILRSPKRASCWADAHEILGQEIERLQARAEFDKFGWRDEFSLYPEPSDPRAVFEEAVAKIHAVAGDLFDAPESRTKIISEANLFLAMPSLIEAAKLLRWVRRCAPNPRDWGAAMGVLRWASREVGRGKNEGLREVLEDDFVPPKRWAEWLERDALHSSQNRAHARLMETVPSLEGSLGIATWLEAAFPVFTNPQIAKLLVDVREHVLALTNDSFASTERNTRSRLRKLQAIFRIQTDFSATKLPESKPSAVITIEEAHKPIPAEEVLTKVRGFLQGKRILFVSNRDDAALQRRLEEELGCVVVLKNGGNNKRMQSVLSSVSANSYDMVLMATSFINHNADGTLCTAAKSEGLPYIRVNKGRPLAVVRALARMFSLSGECNAADDVSTVEAD